MDFQVYGFSCDEQSSRPSGKLDVEVRRFLNDADYKLVCLNRFPNVKKLFLHANTTVPLSAAVERLFSFAGMIFSPRRNRLSPETFRNLVLLKANRSIIEC